MEATFDSDFIAGIKKIQQAKKSHRLVVFVGAGASVDSGVPTWAELIKVMKQEIGLSVAENDFLKIAQMYYNQRGLKEYNDLIRQTLGYRNVSPNPLHRAILDLSPEHIITTNYDDLLEQTVEQEAAAYSFVKQDPDLPYVVNSNLIIKMHGDLELLNMVLKEDDYINYECHFPLINSFVSGLFASRLILFIGFGFSDWNLKVIMQRVRNILGKDAQPAYLFSDSNNSNIEDQYFRERGVIPIRYSPEIENYLAYKGKFQVEKGLSSKGQILYNFLNFLDEYQSFENEFDSASPLLQMYESLKRYEEIPFLPPHTIPRIFPFKSTYTFQRFKLDTNTNEKLKTFFKKIAVNGSISAPLSDEVIIDLGLNNVGKVQERFAYVIKKLRNSLITQVDDFKLIHNQVEKCNCPRCCYDRLDLSEVFTQTSHHSGYEYTASPYEKMMSGYLKCRIGDFTEGYYLYKQAAQEAWKAKLFVLYFICLATIKKIKFLIEYESDENTTDIIKQINKIDLYSILGKIPVDDFVREQIIFIIENRFFSEVSYSIGETIRKIQDTSEFYENKGRRSGGDAEYAELQWLIIQLNSYYNRNYLYYEDYDNYQNLITQAFDGLLMAYELSPKYHFRLKEFQDYFLVIAILHCNAEYLWQVIQRHNYPSIKIASQPSKDSYRSIINVSINFFKSFHNDFWGPSRQMQAANNHFFTRKCGRICSNLLNVLALAEIEADDLSKIAPHFIQFLEHQSILWAHPQVKIALKFFLQRKQNIFTNEEAEKMLSIMVSDKVNYDDVKNELCELLSNRKNYQISDKLLIDTIITKAYYLKSDTWVEMILPLSKIVPASFKKRCQKLISRSLLEKFDPFLYINAVEQRLLKPDQYFDLFLKHSLAIIDEINNSDENKVNSPFWAHHKKYLEDQIDCLFYFIGRHNFSLDDERIELIAQNSSYYQWLVNFDTFDYEKFNDDWFDRWPTRVYIKRMKDNFKVKGLFKHNVQKLLAKKTGRRLARIFLKEFVE
ncbi:hypothetical protein GCM10028808_70780 [Spirosoma migulaei]